MTWSELCIGDVIVDTDHREASAFVVLDRNERWIKWLSLFTGEVVNGFSSSVEDVPSYWQVFKMNEAE